MINFIYLKKIIIFFFKIIFNMIFFLRSFKNYLKILTSKNINSFYLPNISIKNIIFINPSKIKYKGNANMKFKKKSTPFIFDFESDKNNIDMLEFEKKHHSYIACNQLFIKNFRIKECKEYFFFKEQIQKFGKYKGCKSDRDIELYFEKLLNLYENIKKNGIKTNIDNNLDFMIDRNNNLVKINGGNHRFAISRILQLKKVPIEIKLISVKSLHKCLKEKIDTKELNNFIKEIEQKYN